MILRAGSVPGTEAQSGYPDPFNLGRGFLSYLNFGDAGGLTQFGVALETLLPGKQSSQMHWHEKEDEFLYLLSGALTVRRLLLEGGRPHRALPAQPQR